MLNVYTHFDHFAKHWNKAGINKTNGLACFMKSKRILFHVCANILWGMGTVVEIKLLVLYDKKKKIGEFVK